MRTSKILLIFALSAGSALGAAPVKNGTALKRGISAEEYRAAVSDLKSCEDFEGRLDKLPDAAPLMIGALVDSKLPKKDEFETSTQFEQRQAAYWQARLGDLDRVIIRVPIEGYKVTYDADRSIAIVKYLTDWMLKTQYIEFFKASEKRGSYVGTNAYGVSVNVNSYRDMIGRLEIPLNSFSGDAVPANRQWTTSSKTDMFKQWEIPLDPRNARAFKERPSLVILVRVVPPFLTYDSHYAGATIDSPTALSLNYRNFQGQIRCAAFVSGSGFVVKSNAVSRF